MKIEDLNKIVNHQDLIDICKTLYPTTAETIFFSTPLGAFSRLGSLLCYKITPINLIKINNSKYIL